MLKRGAILAAAIGIPMSALAEQPPPSAFGIVAHTPLAELDVLDYNGQYDIYAVKPPIPMDGPWRYAVKLSPDKRVCEVIADTPALPSEVAGALKARLYLRFASRHGSEFKGKEPFPLNIHVWAPADGTAARITLMLNREPLERESVFVQYSFLGPDGKLCYPGQI